MTATALSLRGPWTAALRAFPGDEAISCDQRAVKPGWITRSVGAPMIAAVIRALGMALAMGWQLPLGELVGAPLMVVLLVLLFRMFLSRDLREQAKKQTEKGVYGRMEGHAEMDMSVTEGGSLWQRMTSDRGRTAISHYFVMDWASVWVDIVGGLLIAGALAAWVPHAFWQSFFLVDHPLLATVWGPIAGP